MGIPRFFSWLQRQNFHGVLNPTIPGNVSVMIFDMNSLIHEALHIAYAYDSYFNPKRAEYIRKAPKGKVEQEFYSNLMTLVMNAVTRVAPKDYIVMAVDGVAPQAKIQQQRQRRYRGHRIPREETEELRKPIIDPNMVTPGTAFMFRLDDFLTSWLSRNGFQLMATKVIYSSHLVPGEGEHKYLELLRSGQIPTTGVHVVHGMDADLFILSMISPVPRVYITRDDIGDIVSINNLRHNFLRYKIPAEDFAFLTFFIGNDFLPHQPSLLNMKKAFDALVSAYPGKLVEKTPQGHRINWKNLQKLFKTMKVYETSLISEEAIHGFKSKSIPFEKALESKSRIEKPRTEEEQAQTLKSHGVAVHEYTFNFDIFRNYWYCHALSPKGDTHILDLILGKEAFPITEKKIKEMATEYLKGLAWNIVYYLDGREKMALDYFYPYHYAPLFYDLCNILPTLDTTPLEKVFREDENPEIRSFGPLEQLLAVLPFESEGLLPPEIKSLMEFNSPIYDMFPHTFLLDRMMTNQSWEGVALLPFAEGTRIINAVNSLELPEKILEKYQPGKDLVVAIEETELGLYRKRKEHISKIKSITKKK